MSRDCGATIQPCPKEDTGERVQLLKYCQYNILDGFVQRNVAKKRKWKEHCNLKGLFKRIYFLLPYCQSFSDVYHEVNIFESCSKHSISPIKKVYCINQTATQTEKHITWAKASITRHVKVSQSATFTLNHHTQAYSLQNRIQITDFFSPSDKPVNLTCLCNQATLQL